MSQYPEGKDYQDYFNSLEKQLNTVSKPKPQNSSVVAVESKRLKLRKSTIAILLVLIIISVTLTTALAGKNDKPSVEENGQTQNTQQIQIEEKPISFKVANDCLAIPDTNDAKNAIIINSTTGEIIAQREPLERVPVASTIKIMTLLVAAENTKDFNETFTMTYKITDPLYVAEASVAGFSHGEECSVKDMLYGLILPSGADAAVGLAIKTAGSEEAFVKLMNQRAKKMGLKNTNFTNCSGLYSKNNYSCAYDMAIILATALENEVCKEVLSTYTYTTAVTPQHPEGIKLFGTLFSNMYGTEPETATILGGKTGFVNESGYCIASFGKANQSENEYIIVTLNNSSKWPAFHGQIDLYKNFAK